MGSLWLQEGWAHKAYYVLGQVSRRAPREQGLLGDASPETDSHMPGQLEDVSQVTTSSREVGFYYKGATLPLLVERAGSCTM
ncbi:MAG: hypothetical protein GY774_29110 [Planctomycetes bacterium]|nr:hypothetical protein [Planctomycetota bacterium]